MYKIVIAVTAFSGMNGLGGHYFSALTTARELSKKHEVNLIAIGDFFPEAIRVEDVNVHFFKYKVNVVSICPCDVKKFVSKIAPEVIVAFDRTSGSILRMLSARKNIGFVQVKAGGPVPRTPMQNSPFQVHLSKEDYKRALSKIRYKNKVIAWIPNRVEDTPPDDVAIDRLKRDIGLCDDEIVIIRISRVCGAYENAFLAAINAAQIIRERGYRVRLVMIGHVSHRDAHDRIVSAMTDQDVLLTDLKYTKNARRYLHVAHVNLGVGRGFMEGCSAGNYMLAMAGCSNVPVVVTENNFHDLFEENFSLRARSSLSDDKREEDLVSMVEKVVDYPGPSKLSRTWFQKYFNSGRIIDLYTPILDAAAENREKIDAHVWFDAAVFFVKKHLGRMT